MKSYIREIYVSGGPWLAPSQVTLPRRYMDCLCHLGLLFQFVDLGSRNVKLSSTFWLFQAFSILRQHNIIIYLLILGTRVGKFSRSTKWTKKNENRENNREDRRRRDETIIFDIEFSRSTTFVKHLLSNSCKKYVFSIFDLDRFK